jgi:hypothetical protein
MWANLQHVVQSGKKRISPRNSAYFAEREEGSVPPCRIRIPRKMGTVSPAIAHGLSWRRCPTPGPPGRLPTVLEEACAPSLAQGDSDYWGGPLPGIRLG